MQCPKCNVQMEQGELELKAWGLGLAPQAQLYFGAERLLQSQYWPVVGLFRGGKKTVAYRCRGCTLVCFHYEEDATDKARA